MFIRGVYLELKGLYLEHTEDGHDKWWALVKKGDGYECWYGGRGKVHAKPTFYNRVQAQKKFDEKIGKGYITKGEIKSKADLTFIQDAITQGEDGWQKFKRLSSHKTEEAPKRKRVEKTDFNFMAELRKV